MSLKKSTIKFIEKKCKVNLNGKTVVITGANSGIGFKTAETFVYCGSSVVMACRNCEKAEEAKKKLLTDYPNAQIIVLQLDLADFASIENFVNEIKKRKIDIDCFINNAGVFHQPNQKTKDGFELVMGTNFIGTFYLTELVYSYLLRFNHSATLINTLSLVYKFPKLDYADFYSQKKYKNFSVYSKSKLALAKYTHYLANLQGYSADFRGVSNVKVYGVHPGISITPIANKAYPRLGKLAKGLRFLFNSTEKSSLAPLFIMANNLPSGSVVGPKCLFSTRGFPRLNRISKKMKQGCVELVEFARKEIEKVNKARF